MSGCGTGDSKDSNAVVVWHWMSDREEVFQELATRFQSETGLKVRFELYAPSEVYAQRVKGGAQTNTLPDVFGVLGEKRDLASFINSGFVMDLTPELEKMEAEKPSWKESFFEKALAVTEFKEGNEYGVKPGFYGVPIDVMTIQMVYNKMLLQKAGLPPDHPPATWKEFVDYCKTLKNKGLPRFVSGFGEIWMIDALASNLAMNLMGEEKVFDTYRGKVAYTDPDWIRLFSLFKEMVDEKMFVEGVVTMVNKTAEQTFANERAAFAFNGSWCINVYKGMNPNLNYGAMLPPRVSLSQPMRVWGGAGGAFMVNAHSPRRDAAVRFLKWFTSPDIQVILSEKTENLPSNKQSLKNISPILAQFADDMETATHPNLYPVHELPAVTETFDKGIQSILIGEKTPQQVAEEVQRIKEKESKKL